MDFKELEKKVNSEIVISKNNLISEIKKIIFCNSNILIHRQEFVTIVHLIGKRFDSLFDCATNNEDTVAVRAIVVDSLISNKVIDIFLSSLCQIFDAIDSDKLTPNAVDADLHESMKILLDILRKCSELSEEFGDEICKRNDLTSLLFRILHRYQHQCGGASLSKQHREVVELCWLNLYNTAIHDSEANIHKLRSLRIVDLIRDYAGLDNENLQLRLLMFSAYFTDESDTIMSKKERILLSRIIDLLRNSVMSTGEYATEFTIEELIKGIEKLSKFDENKILLVELKILPILKNVLEKYSFVYEEIVISILWNLAFDDRNKALIKKLFLPTNLNLNILLNLKTNDGLTHQETEENTFPKGINTGSPIEKITAPDQPKLRNDPLNNSDVKKLDTIFSKSSKKLNGLLWTLRGQRKSTENLDDNNILNDEVTLEKHIMISYCHKNLKTALIIYEELHKRGFKLWIDKHDMEASVNLMEAMGQAVENSMAIIMCVSHCYKNSESCRAEAQYAKERKRPLIPILIEEKYRPDGWLGICIAGLKYHNFTGKYNLEESIEILVKELKQMTSKHKSTNVPKPMIITDHQDSKNSKRNESGVRKNVKVSDWTNAEVRNWFQKIGIKKVNWKSHYTGFELEFLKTISGEKFVDFCKTDLEISDLKEMRILSEEIKKL